MSAETESDGDVVHTPGAEQAATADGDGGGESDGTVGSDVVGESDGTVGSDVVGEGTEPVADGFGRKGWALTAALFVCVLVIPGIIYVYPYAAGSFGLTFFGTYLVLPLIPAVLLGLIAVWSMTAATADREPGN